MPRERGEERVSFAEYLGLLAGFLTTFSMVPQIVRVFRLKSAREISTSFTVLLLAGMLLWLAYGVVGGLLSVIVWNTVAAALVATLLYAKLRYGRHPV